MEKAKKSITTARLLSRGEHQYVVLPKGFAFKGDRVRIRKFDGGVLLEPVGKRWKVSDVRKWFAEMDRHRLSADCFEGEWRNQPQFPVGRKQTKP